MAQIDLGSIKFNWKGSYSGATAYVVDDVVESSGSSYICIAATTGNAPPNATYWELMSSAGTNGTDGTDLTTTLTTQGDIVYRDGSGLQRLAIGTAGQVLKVNSGATALEYGVGSDVLGRASFENSTRTSLSATSTANTEFWSFTYNRQSSTSDLIVHAIMPMMGDENWPDIGDHIRISAGNTFRSQRGVFHSGRGSSANGPWSFLCIARYTAAEIGSSTGNITIAFGWNINSSSVGAVRPAAIWNPSVVDDTRVSGSQTISSALITEID